MKHYIVAPEAENDLESIFNYIAKDNPIAAERTLADLITAMNMLADFPEIGCFRPDISPDKELRFWPAKFHYQIIYSNKDPIEILRVVSGYRDIVDVLSCRSVSEINNYDYLALGL